MCRRLGEKGQDAVGERGGLHGFFGLAGQPSKDSRYAPRDFSRFSAVTGSDRVLDRLRSAP
jgi:hypothetical protein